LKHNREEGTLVQPATLGWMLIMRSAPLATAGNVSPSGASAYVSVASLEALSFWNVIDRPFLS
jgi:hypothetical protein